jgi:hypothetical protein
MIDESAYPRFRVDMLRPNADRYEIAPDSYCHSLNEIQGELERLRRQFPKCDFRVIDEEEEVADDLARYDPRSLG